MLNELPAFVKGYLETGTNANNPKIKHLCWEALVRNGFNGTWAYAAIYG